MQRRTLLRLGLGAATLVALAGGAIALLRPGLSNGRLTPAGQSVFRAVARAVLDGSLPAAEAARVAALKSHLARLDDALAAFAAPTQAELSQLLALLAAPPGRIAVAGLNTDWDAASVTEIQLALQDMRTSRLALRQQAYHALRDLTNAAFYADAQAWPLLGYPGPVAL
jgi:hypothetical protein